MIQRIQLGSFNNYRVNNTNNNASKPISPAPNSMQNLSFKSSGDYLYEETESMINQIREKAFESGAKTLSATHPDGTRMVFTPEKKGMSLYLENIAKDTRKTYGLIDRAEIETRNNAVVYYSKCPTFLLNELDEGLMDTFLQKYLPELLK